MNRLVEILKLGNLEDYKVRFCIRDKKEFVEPLDYLYDEELLSWIGWKNKNNVLKGRKYVVSFVKNYLESNREWVFSGIYEVKEKPNFANIYNDVGYDLVRDKLTEDLIGKLVVYYKAGQNHASNLENVINNIKIVREKEEDKLEKEQEEINNLMQKMNNFNVDKAEVVEVKRNLSLIKYRNSKKDSSYGKVGTKEHSNKIVSDIAKGYMGECVEERIFKWEYNRLLSLGLDDRKLEEMVNFRKNKKDSFGYDILSFRKVGSEFRKTYIEVKATSKIENTPFELSANEYEFARKHKNNYVIYRVVNVTEDSLELYKILGTQLFKKYNLKPTNYRVWGR